MNHIFLPVGLLSGLLFTLPAAGQHFPSAAAASPPPVQAPPAPPALDDPTAPLLTEPNPATRQLYVRQRVRSVLKVRLDDEGQVRDTVEYQEVDAQGRRTLLCRYGPGWKERREWSYDDAGNCTSLVIHPVPGRSFTTINTYNPSLGRSRCEVLQANGRRTTVCEVQRRQSGDTLLTEARFWTLFVGHYQFAADGYRRTCRFALSPDTVLTLVSNYTPKGRLQSTHIQYELLRNGQIKELGTVDVRQALRADKRQTAQQPAEQVPFRQLAALLHRNPESLKPTTRFRYDDRQRLMEQQHFASAAFLQPPSVTTLSPGPGRAFSPSARSTTFSPVSVRTVLTNTYNDLDQLIGQQRRLIGVRSSPTQAYAVLSYLPEGLPAGETSRFSGPPVFCRYQYRYYE